MRRRLINERALKHALAIIAAAALFASCGKTQPASQKRDAAEASAGRPDYPPGPPSSIVSMTPGPPWPANGITLASKDGSTERRLSVDQGNAIGVAIESHLRSETPPGETATKHEARLKELTTGPPMADGPRVGQFLLRIGELNTLEAVATLEVRAHDRYGFVLEIKESAGDFSVGRSRTEMSDGSGH